MPSPLAPLRRHRERQRPSGFGFAFADRVDYFDPRAWDALTTPASVFLSRDYLRVLEAHGPDNVEPRYALVFRGDEPVAAVATQLVTVTPDRVGRGEEKDQPSRRPKLRRALSRLASRTRVPLIQQRMLVNGNLLSWGFHGVAFAPSADPADAWRGVAEALYRIRRAERLTGQTNVVMIKDLGADHASVETMRRFSYRPLETEPNMVLTLQPAWQTYNDYAAALDSKRRSAIRDREKKLAAAGCTVERIADLDPIESRLHELYLAVHERATIRLVTLPSAFLPALARVKRDDFRCTVVRRGDEILGFVTTMKDGDTAVAYYIGFDRAAAESGVPLYLRLLHATVADAIEWRCSRLSLGRTALEPKAGLGAKPEPMHVWLRHRVPAINWVLRGMLGAVPHAEAPERNPFKASGKN